MEKLMVDYITIAGTIALATTITVTPVQPAEKIKTDSGKAFISIKNEISPYNITDVINIEVNDDIQTDGVIEIPVKGTVSTELCQSKKIEFEWV